MYLHNVGALSLWVNQHAPAGGVSDNIGLATRVMQRYNLRPVEYGRETVTQESLQAIDFRRDEVRRFFTDNALYWLLEYRFDGLRFDAVHAITERNWLDEMAAEIRKQVSDRQVSNREVFESESATLIHLIGRSIA